tara:strand:+ start:888 stop:1127 length:240 start_codon:yes stop_codon:yes gene_type:complete
MSKQKQSRVEGLEKKVEALIRVVKQILDENAYLKDLSVGTLETVKKLPGYDKAIEELKQQLAEETGEAQEANTGRKIIE